MSGYEVDLSYLQDTVKKLQGVADGMDDANQKAQYQTNLIHTQIGSETFIEASNLHTAHDNMKTQLANMIKTLQTMIQEFTDKTGSAHDQYAAQDTQTSQNFSRGAS
ncbi:type VII secretion target [Streptacidiphilus neutrinimicus]|uniref:type VII secretion target n=1 Tax=Streptacidiphilus neutrinimicus TaxID=105420 RepID=UPI000693313B|nr:type VII secretion target [Streptacidiphilus neutrinimicus]